ncbi:MAG: hypothetical protein U0744_01035 [Gemmataceae bacterium]
MSEPKRRAKSADELPRPSWLRVLLGQVLPPLFWVAVVVALVGGIIWLGRAGRERLQDDPKYLVALREIQCDPPLGMTRETFLDEVQYVSQLTPKVSVLDERLPDRLRDAFATHPWVLKVDDVKIDASKRIAVRLTYRTPVLAVYWDNRWRAVDADAILLPQNAPTQDLPRFRGNAKAPQGPSGSAWGDAEVAKQAREVGKR